MELRGLRVSGAFLAVVLAMALLGPAPAVAIGCGRTLVDACVARAAAGDKALNERRGLGARSRSSAVC